MGPKPRDPLDRFFEKILVDEATDCWLWAGFVDKATGYGTFYYRGRSRQAHRFSYEAFVGSIPDGLQIDHGCRVRCCVQPGHLSAMTLMENLLAGDRSYLGQWQRERTACPQGHPYDDENTYRHQDGRRFCRACNRERMRQRRAT